MPGTMLDLVPNMPQRLKELRTEVGWTLGQVAERVGVTQRGVVSNWEATNQRHRIPDIANLLILQRWYGVSLDYLLGQPGALRDSPAVSLGKEALKERLATEDLRSLRTPTDRARWCVSIATVVAPEAFFTERLAVYLGVTQEDFESLLKASGDMWSDDQIHSLSNVVGLPVEWFYGLDPSKPLPERVNEIKGQTC